ncbi:MAG TPA: hypothetical protein VGL22_13555 [Terracidiphilus sp.]|jgi:hypothetical protein
MPVNIDELHVETESPAPSAAPPAKTDQQPQPDLQADLEKLRERELRLQAD